METDKTKLTHSEMVSEEASCALAPVEVNFHYFSVLSLMYQNGIYGAGNTVVLQPGEWLILQEEPEGFERTTCINHAL